MTGWGCDDRTRGTATWLRAAGRRLGCAAIAALTAACGGADADAGTEQPRVAPELVAELQAVLDSVAKTTVLPGLTIGLALPDGATIGLAAGFELNTTVMPFILRAVCLLGINSVDTPRDLRLAVWRRIGSDLKPRHLDKIASNTIGFDDLPGAFDAFIEGKVTGRTVVEIG